MNNENKERTVKRRMRENERRRKNPCQEENGLKTSRSLLWSREPRESLIDDGLFVVSERGLEEGRGGMKKAMEWKAKIRNIEPWGMFWRPEPDLAKGRKDEEMIVPEERNSTTAKHGERER